MTPDPTTPLRPRPRPFDFLGALVRAQLSRADDGLFSTSGAGRVVGGTAPAHVVARRRAANKAARVSRRANRRSAR